MYIVCLITLTVYKTSIIEYMKFVVAISYEVSGLHHSTKLIICCTHDFINVMYTTIGREGECIDKINVQLCRYIHTKHYIFCGIIYYVIVVRP